MRSPSFLPDLPSTHRTLPPSIGATARDRPAAAPQNRPYELGYYAIAHPTFVAGMTASATICVSSAGTSAFLPVISEMRHPKDYRKAVFTCMALVNATYLSFSLVVREMGCEFKSRGMNSHTIPPA